MIVGVDEVGRGSWAGPLCVAAVLWPDDFTLPGLNDSKKVPLAKRPGLAHLVREHAIGVGIGWVSAPVIDMIGLSEALKSAARIAISQLPNDFTEIIVDGNFQLLSDPRAKTLIKADATVPAVMAASIIAKVARDSYMCALDHVHGQYQFTRHVGYGTALHKAMLAEHGPCVQHRMSFAPLKGVAI